MNRVFNVALREYLETVKTKFFIISIFLTPAIMVGVMFLVRYMDENLDEGELETRRVAILDRTDRLGINLNQVFDGYNTAMPARPIELTVRTADGVGFDAVIEELKQDVRDDRQDACVDIAESAIEGTGKSYYYSDASSIADMQFLQTVKGLLQQAINNARFKANNVSPALVAQLTRPLDLVSMDVVDEEEFGGGQIAKLATPFFFVMMLVLGIFATSQGMLTSVIEEKNTRIVEVLLSAVSPFELMAGKIVGLTALGLSVIFLWTASAYAAAISQGYGEYVNFAGTQFFLIYFIFGFVLISSLYAAIGAACNSIQESQSLMTPLMLLLMSPMFAIAQIVNNPDGKIALFFSFFPLTSAMVMPIRMAAKPDLSLFQIWGSIALLAVSVPAVMWVAARIFRTGILMYGKPPSFRELFRWVRQS